MRLDFNGPLNVDQNGKVPLKIKSASVGDEKKEDVDSDVVIPIDYSTTNVIYEIEYFGGLDIISSIGGVNAFFAPMLKVFAPILCLSFLVKFSYFIKRKDLRTYH